MGDTVRLGRRARRKRPVLPLILAAIAALLVAVGSVALALRQPAAGQQRHANLVSRAAGAEQDTAAELY